VQCCFDIDPRGFFAPKRPTDHQNEFGFNISGPVKKDKIFFFANYDGFRFTQHAQPSLASIPTEAERNGNFSGLPAGWQLSGILTYRSGLPIGTIGAACNLANTGGCYAN